MKINGTDGVLVHANGSLDLHEARDVRSESNNQTVKKSGFAGSIGGIPVPIGAGSRNETSTSSHTTVASSITSANGGVLLQGDGAAILRGVQVNAAEDVTIKGGTVSITGATNYASSTSEQYTRGTKIGASLVHDLGKGIDAKNTDKGEQQASTLARTTLSGANVTVTSTGADGEGGLLTMTGTTVNTPGALTLNADKLILGTQTTQVDTSNTSQGGDWAWQKAKGQGASDQTTNYNQFNVGTLATPVQSVQIGLGARDSISALAQQPGMAWINQIANDPTLAGKVDWTQVEEAHRQWDYKQQGLTPAAAAVVTLVVAYFTAGAASGLGAAAGESAAVAVGEGVAMAGGGAFVSAGAGVAISSVVGGAVTAGVAALAGQAAVAVINNKGDIGGALNDLGSSANVKGLLTAIATGGVLGGLNLNPTGLPTEGTGAQKFMDQLGQNLQAGAAKAVIGTAINGGSLEDSLKSNLKNALLDTMAAQSANAIGDITAGDGTLDEFANKVAHAIAGCAVGAARADTSGGCGAGAIGAAVGEIAAEAYGRQADTTAFAAMVSAIAVAATGASAAEIHLASQAGANAAANNSLNHIRPSMLRLSEKEQYDAAAASCATGDKAACATRTELAILSERRDQQLAQACAGSSPDLCNSLAKDAMAMGNVVHGTQGGLVYANSPTATSLNTSTAGPVTRPDNFQDTVARSTSEAIALEVGNQALGALIGVGVKGAAATSSAVSNFFASQGISVAEGTSARIASNFGRDGDAFTAAAGRMVAARDAGWKTVDGRIWWPPGSGEVPGTQFQTTLKVGTKLDRYGGTGSNSTFLAPVNTSLEQRALSPTTNIAIRDEYIVLKPLPVEQSNTMPWFGQSGMGQQFNTGQGGLTLKNGKPATIENLVESGYLKKVTQ